MNKAWFHRSAVLSNNSVTFRTGISRRTPTHRCPKVVNALAPVVAGVPVARGARVHAHPVLLEADRPQVGQHLAVDDYPLHGPVQRQHYPGVGAEDAGVTEKENNGYFFVISNV